MGLNVVTVCKRHKVYNYSMRTEEFVDFQAIMRSHHRECMEHGQVFIICDADTDITNESSEYSEMWDYEARPEIIGISEAAKTAR